MSQDQGCRACSGGVDLRDVHCPLSLCLASCLLSQQSVTHDKRAMMPRVIPHQQSATWYSQSDTDAAQPEKIVCNNRTAYNLAPEALLSPRMEGDCVRGMRGAVVLFQEVTEGEKLDKNLAKKKSVGKRRVVDYILSVPLF